MCEIYTTVARGSIVVVSLSLIGGGNTRAWKYFLIVVSGAQNCHWRKKEQTEQTLLLLVLIVVEWGWGGVVAVRVLVTA